MISQRFQAPVVLPMDPEGSVLRDAVVDVDDAGRVAYCGPAATAPRVADARSLRLTGILIPGLVNTHAHSAMTSLRGMGGDLPLTSWLNDVIWPAEGRMRPSDAGSGMRLGCIEMLQSGITTSAEMYFHPEVLVEAALEVGNRLLVAPAFLDAPGSRWRDTLASIDKWIDADGLRFGPNDRIEIAYGPHSAYMLAPEALEATAESAMARGALVHIHIAESRGEDHEVRSAYGSVPRLLNRVGLLDGRLLAAHAVHLSPQDIDLFAHAGTGVAHCPGSNAKLASGVAPLAELRAASVPVGLGTDGPASNDDLDLWEEMRLAAMFSRLAADDAMALTAKDTLLMATRGGAAALGRTDIGSLEPGKWADMVHINVDGPQFAVGLDIPDTRLLSTLVWAAGSRAVSDVWVGGERVVTKGEPARVDRFAVQRSVAESAKYLNTA
ncbi:amidohydrolase family protein [Streptomyces sp. NPDC056663]|uniref:amidohydrolase family protein n=1 Tax=Streptomyces sp. NPDC056663 TaxID=3345899 RepID=UPI0036A503BB